MLNKKIRELRISANMSQVQLAKRLGVTKQSVSNWENDNIQPSIEMLIKVAKVFAVSTDFLLGLSSDNTIDVSGLSEDVIAHLRLLIDDYKKQNQQ